MSDNKTTVVVDVQTNLAQAIVQSEKLKNNLKEAGAGRTTYAQAAAKGVRAGGGHAAEDSNTARGIGGQTGAAGRDFAAQARGLGGLVHVYATFAANLFAVSAAFTALNKAANIENMVKGLDQLGASSGKNLGNLAKSVVEVSDGALSLADSMTAVAQASSGGITSKNILRMTEVAKKASQALGRDMPDAMSRLSRGITKVEPELLDELGIMVKVSEASDMYARQLGKTASSLTDFEKRQGYANAVLAEGERKFGSIQLDANPYQKILASITDLAIKGGTLLNKILGPILDILSKSPTALSVALAGIGTVLIKQAIPALGAWRANMQEAAKSSREAFLEANKLRINKLTEKDTEFAINFAAKEKAATDAVAKAYNDLATNKTRTAKTSKLLNIDLANVTQNELTALEKQAVARGKLRLLDDDASTRSKKSATNAQIEAAQLNNLTAALKNKMVVEAEGNKLHASITPTQKLGGYFSNDQARNRIADKAAAEALKSNILGNIAKNLPVSGIVDSFISLKSAIGFAMKGMDEAGNPLEDGQKKLTKLGAAATAVRGTFTILGSGISTLIMSLTNVLAVIGLVVGALALIDMGFSNATKEIEKFNTASDNTNAAIENIDRTLGLINKKEIGKGLSVETIQARANAFNELSDSLEVQIKSFSKLNKVLENSPWDKFKDSIKSIFGMGIKNTISESITVSINNSLKLINDSKLREEYLDKLKSIFNGKITDFTGINLNKQLLEQFSNGQLEQSLTKITDLFGEINLKINNAASYASSFASGIDDIAKSVDQMNTKLAVSDDSGKIGEKLVKESINLSNALKQPLEGIASIQSLLKSTQTLSLLPETAKKQLLEASTELNNFQINYDKTNKSIVLAQEELDNLSKKEQELNSRAVPRGGEGMVDKIRDDIRTAKQVATIKLDAAKKEKSLLESTGYTLTNAIKNISDTMFNTGIDRLSVGLNSAFREGGIIVAKSYLSVLKSAGGNTAEAEGKLRKEELDIQLDLINLTYGNIKSQEGLKLAIEELSLLEQRKLSQANGGDRFRVAEIDKKLSDISKKKDVLSINPEIITKALQNKVTGNTTESDNSLGGINIDELKKYLKDMPSILSASIVIASQRSKILSEQKANTIQTEAAKKDEKSVDKQKELQAEISILDSERKNVELAQTAKGIFDDILQTKKEELETELAIKQYYLNIEPILNKIAKAGTNKEVEAKARRELVALSEKYAADDAERVQKNTQTRLAGLEEIRIHTVDYNAKYREISKELGMSEVSQIESVLSARQSLGQISEQNLAIEQANLELLKAEYSAGIERGSVLDNYSKKVADLNNALKLKPNDPDLLQRLEEEKILYNKQVEAINAKNTSVAVGVELTKQAKIEQADWNQLLKDQKDSMETILSATVSLGVAFGKIGTAVGAFAAALTKTAQKQVELDKEISNNRKKYSQPKDAERLAKEEEKYTDKTTELKLDAIQEVTAASRSAFKENSKMSEALLAIEKGIAVYKAVMAVKEIALTYAVMEAKSASAIQESAQTSFRIAERQAEAVVEGGTAVLSQGKADPYTAFARMAAMAAAVAAILSSIGASNNISVPPVGNTAEEMQKTQGTGQKYDSNGKLVSNGGGVFGDQEAKSESIKNSLEIIKDNTIEGLGYDSKMLKALESIDQGINNTAKSLYNVAGIRSGSITGTSDITTSSHGIKNLFGSSSTKEIIDSGIELSGTFSQLAKSAKGLVRAYETIRTTKTKSGFFGIGGGTSITDSKNYIGVSTDVENEITAIFKNAADLFTTVGEKIGITAAEVTKKLDSIDIGNAFTSLRGLKGDELEKEFSAVIGSILDNASSTIFASMSKYAQFGEGLLETTVRVVDGFEKVKVDLSAISVSVDKFTYDISEALIKNAGGLDEFTSQLSFFSDNFLTESERLAPITKNVGKVLSSLGLSSVDTREEFAYIVKSLDLTTKAGQDTYQQLMDIAGAFADVHAETRVVLSTEERLSQLRSQYVRILELENKKLESVALSRQIELDAMDDILKLGAKYIWAMEDELELKTQLTEAHDKEAAALQSTIDGLTASIDTLNKYRDSLKLGSQSILTPSEKYAEAKSQAERVAEIANSIATTEAEKKAKSEAISNLPAAAGAFLEASRTLFASSGQYTTDYNTVLALVSSTSSALEVQKSTAEQQLDTLNAQYDSLGIIKDSTSTMAELMPQFLAAQDRTTAAMTAYYAAGGPNQGPPLPANGIDQNVVNASVKLQNDALLKEVQLLNKQIDALRKEQSKQTADLVLAEKAIADAKMAANKAAADAAAASTWVNANSPWYDSGGNWVSTGS